MTERHYKLKCLGRDVTMIVDDEKGVAFDGYDERAERSLKAFGKSGSSPCWIVAHAVVNGTVGEECLRFIDQGETKIAIALIATGKGINFRQKIGWHYDITPLHMAIARKNIDIVKALLEHEHLFVNARDKDKLTPLHRAAVVCRADIAELLLKRKDILVNAPDKHGEPPLTMAAAHDCVPVAEALLNHKDIDVNKRDNVYLATPLHWAVAYGRPAIVEVLLKHPGIVVDLQNRKGYTPLDLARGNNDKKTIRLIEDWLEKHHDA